MIPWGRRWCGAAAVVALAWPAGAQWQAQSPDGLWWLRASEDGTTLVLADAAQVERRRWSVTSLDHRRVGTVRQVLAAAARNSFVVSFQGLPELWEISLDPQAPPIHDGLVHDHRMGEALAQSGFLGVRRTPLDAPVQVVYIDPDARQVLLCSETPGTENETQYLSVHLDARTVLRRFSVRRKWPDAPRQ